MSGFTKTELLENSFSVQLSPFFSSTLFDDSNKLTHTSDGLLQRMESKGIIESFESLGIISCMLNSPKYRIQPNINVSPAEDAAVFNQQYISSFSDSTTVVQGSDVCFTRSIDLQTKGYCMTALNRVQMDVNILPINNNSNNSVSSSSSNHRGVEIVPWRNTQNEVIPILFRLFSMKLMSLLADKPGSTLSQIASALPLLSERQTELLLNDLMTNKLISSKSPAVCSRKTSPFRSGSNSNSEKVYFLSL